MKRAVLIGINYYGTSAQLNGCVNDVEVIYDLLLANGYLNENIVILTDDINRKDLLPTKKNIMRSLKEAVKETKTGDTLFVSYSGHGSYATDWGGDERDGKDEVLCTVDNQYIVDDKLRAKIVNKVPKGAKLRCFFDCCHSGSSLDLPYCWKGGEKFVSESKANLDNDCILISGCRDNQTSSDAYIREVKNYNGALTYYLLKTINETNGNVSWKELITILRYRLRKHRYVQIPQLSSSNKKNTNGQIDF